MVSNFHNIIGVSNIIRLRVNKQYMEKEREKLIIEQKRYPGVHIAMEVGDHEWYMQNRHIWVEANKEYRRLNNSSILNERSKRNQMDRLM